MVEGLKGRGWRSEVRTRGLGIVGAPLDTDGNSPSPVPHPLPRGRGSVSWAGRESGCLSGHLWQNKSFLAASGLKGVLRYQSCNSSKISGLAPSQPFQDRGTRGSESGPALQPPSPPLPAPPASEYLSTLPLKPLICKRPQWKTAPGRAPGERPQEARGQELRKIFGWLAWL